MHNISGKGVPGRVNSNESFFVRFSNKKYEDLIPSCY